MKDIFSRNADFTKTAFMNWRIHKYDNIINSLNIAEGYFKSAITLSEVCLSDNDDKKADIFIFPILNNVNHGIELYLKSILQILHILNNSEYKNYTHSLDNLFSDLIKTADKYDQELKQHLSENPDLEAYIKEITAKLQPTNKKDKMDFSRYPNKDTENYFYVEQLGNVEIDLENFVDVFSKIYKILDDISSFLYHVKLNNHS